MDKSMQLGSQAGIRKQFYALRNGLIADTLRKGGLPQKYIFGLQLPQLKEIAEKVRPSDPEEAALMARMLWADKDCREARLLACYIMPAALLDPEEAMKWAEGVTTREEADILAFRMLRHLPFAETLATKLTTSPEVLSRYCAEAIRRFF